MAQTNSLPSIGRLLATMLVGGLLISHASVQAEVALGIGTHFGQGRTNDQLFFNWITGSPFNAMREEIYWNDIESSPQQFKPSKRALHTLQVLNKAIDAGIEPLVVLDYGNQFYDEGTQPYSDSARAGFAKYADWVVRETKGRVKQFEIWNEWNIGAGKKPKTRHGDVADYVKLAQQASIAIRKANPGATIIGGALGDDFPDWAWLKEAVRQGLLNHVDGISIHLYNHSLPMYKGGAKEMLERLVKVHQILQSASPTKTIPIYVTEVGWPNNVGTYGVELSDAAIQASIFLLEVNALDYVKGIWFYEFQNGGRNISEREDNFGLLDSDNQPKPMACALQALGQQLKGATLTGSIRLGNARLMLYKLKNGTQLLGVWTPWVTPAKKTQSIELQGTNLDPKPLNLGCFKSANLSPMTRGSTTMKIEQGYDPSFYILPKDATFKF